MQPTAPCVHGVVHQKICDLVMLPTPQQFRIGYGCMRDPNCVHEFKQAQCNPIEKRGKAWGGKRTTPTCNFSEGLAVNNETHASRRTHVVFSLAVSVGDIYSRTAMTPITQFGTQLDSSLISTSRREAKCKANNVEVSMCRCANRWWSAGLVIFMNVTWSYHEVSSLNVTSATRWRSEVLYGFLLTVHLVMTAVFASVRWYLRSTSKIPHALGPATPTSHRLNTYSWPAFPPLMSASNHIWSLASENPNRLTNKTFTS